MTHEPVPGQEEPFAREAVTIIAILSLAGALVFLLSQL